MKVVYFEQIIETLYLTAGTTITLHKITFLNKII